MAKNSIIDSKVQEQFQKTINKKKPKKLPRTVQQSLPYVECYQNGIIQIEPCKFSKTFQFDDISFKTSSDEDQEGIYERYQKFLNTLQPKEDVFITFVNEKENSKSKLDRIAPLMRGDKNDEYRKELTDMLRSKMLNSRNNIITKKYLTVTIEDDDVEKAMQRFKSISGELDINFRKVSKHPLKELTLAERLEMLQKIFNSDEANYWFEHDIDGNVSIDFKRLAKQNLTTKDIIAPSGLKYNGNDFIIGERVGQSLFLDNIANWLNTNFLADLSEVNFESIVTLHIQSIPQSDALKMIHNQSVNINAEVMNKQKKAIQSGYGGDYVPADLQNAKNQIDMLQEDMLNRDQRLFYMSLTMSHFAEDKLVLKEQSTIIKNIASKYMCTIRPLIMQQERGFISSLPLGLNKTMTAKLQTTESLGIFLPFDEINQFDDNGFYYGVNSINKSLIIYDRLKGMNYNGLIFGSPGAGKSFAAKREMVQVYLKTNADIFIIDPEGEYTALSEEFNGAIIKLAPGNGVYINPLDLDIDTSADGEYNPITMKTDFVSGLLETMLGHGMQLTPVQKSIVDRVVNQLYRPYLEHLNDMLPDATGKKPTIDRQSCPTLQDLFDLLLSQKEQEAQILALIMETYTTGSFDTFAHKTNVDVDNRLIIYNIKDIGSNLKELGLKVCLNDIWNKMIDNRKKNKWTWFYVDEFHLLLSSPSTSEFLKSIFKRARKWQGVPTCITQNVEDVLQSPSARAIINNASFILMMNQSAMDRSMLQELLQLSENDVGYITNAEPGCGLIYNGQQSIPFIDNFPKDLKLYKIMTSKPGEAA